MPRGRKKSPAAAFIDNEAAEDSRPPPPEVVHTPKKKKGKTSAAACSDDSPCKNTRTQTSHVSPEKEVPESKPRKSMKRPLTQEEEGELVEWLQENSFLYNKSSAEFKMRDKKVRTWLEKEQQMGLNVGDISLIWYPNMRTQYSKLVKMGTKSGSGLQERTARQTWLLEKFAFIRPYLVQLRHQRGSNFAEKRKEFASSDATDDDVLEVGSDGSAHSSSVASTLAQRPKAAATLVSSLNEELSSLKDSMSGNQDRAASTGQFLVHMMRDMAESTRQEFILTVTKMAIEAVQRDKADLARQHQQAMQQQQIFAVPTRRPLPSAAAGSASQLQPVMYHDQQLQQDFQLASNIATSAPPAHITPQLSSYRHLQPLNVHPVFMPSSSTGSLVLQAMNTVSTPNASFNTSFNSDTFDANLDILKGLPSPLEASSPKVSE